MSSNIGNYRNDADFITEVFPDVYWVPICTLGKSRYSNDEISEQIVKLTPEEKYEKINNLYEAIQLFIISKFTGILDNQNHVLREDDHVLLEMWQTHKSGRDALLTNEGCCATDTNWLAYLLHNKYDFIGSFGYWNEDGNGHVTNYIKHQEWYYFIDLMMCRFDSQSSGCMENGNRDDLLDKEWAGSLFKCKDPLDFVKFNRDRFVSKKRDVPFAFHLRNCKEVTATGLKMTKDSMTFYVPKQDNPQILYIKESPHLDVQIVEAPAFS